MGGAAFGKAVNLGFLANAEIDAALTKHSDYILAEKVAGALGYHVIPLTLRSEIRPRDLKRRLKNLNIRGVLIARLSKLPGAIPMEAFPWESASWVSVGERSVSMPIDRVLLNAFRDVIMALSKLLNLGYRRIVWVQGFRDYGPVYERQRAAWLRFKEQHLEFDFDECVLGGEDSWPKLKPKTAFLTLYPGLQSSLKKKYEDTVAIASLALTLGDSGNAPKLAGVVGNRLGQMETAVELLDASIRRGAMGCQLRVAQCF